MQGIAKAEDEGNQDVTVHITPGFVEVTLGRSDN